ncbi:YveK family protein [Lacticaseibacillus porcinae]|uniref:YveK family protein n=1 Tax=Lacticaseibacillus porcinae TaxID=1123687 RepID=UPI000F7B6785|nr:Wzz/FepE/Etk N-terminal domain-containing protein [Lacticaseibacillus porcinae]
MEKLLSMQRLGYTIWHHMLLIIGLMIVFGGALYVYAAKMVAPSYDVSTTIVVDKNGSNGDQSVSDALNASQYDTQMLATYNDLLNDSALYATVATNLNANGYPKLTSSDVQKMVTVKNNANSRAFSVTVEAATPKLAAKVANTVASSFADKVKTVIGKTQGVKVADEASEDALPVKPNAKLFAIAGLIIGLIIGAAIATLREIFNDTVKDPEFLTKSAKIPYLGTIKVSK